MNTQFTPSQIHRSVWTAKSAKFLNARSRRAKTTTSPGVSVAASRLPAGRFTSRCLKAPSHGSPLHVLERCRGPLILPPLVNGELLGVDTEPRLGRVFM